MTIAQIKKVTTGYVPRPFQIVLHNSFKRFNVLVCHRRFGKTVLVLNEMIDRGLRNERKNPQYAYLAPNYGQAKRVAWDYLKEYTKNIPNVTVNEAELRVEIHRPHLGDKIRFILLGTENPASLRGIYLDGVVLDEYAEGDPSVWGQVVRPALSDRLGWAIFIGTPKGQNHFFEIYELAKKLEAEGKDWYAKSYKASETGVIPESELEGARMEMTEEEYAQEYECSFTAALVGSYFGKLMEDAEKEGRIGNVPYDPAVPVNTFWDLGIGDTTAIWFQQQVGKEHRLIDHIEMSGVGLDWYVRELKKKPYIYGEHTLPHDAGAKELGTGKSRQETLTGLGLRTIILPRQSFEDGIHAARMLLPKIWIDKTKCERGIIALKNYEKKWDSRNKIFQDKPKHNWASHSSDAFRYLALGIGEESQKMYNKELPRQADLYHDF